MKYKSSQKGFTLVEMIISLAIFTVVAVIAIGALLRITDSNSKSHSLKTAINNLNFALESMSREMRVGANYAAYTSEQSTSVFNSTTNEVSKRTANITTGAWYVYFNSTKTAPLNGGPELCNLVYAYKYEGQSISKAEQTSCLQALGSFFPVISDDVKITNSILRVDSSSIVRPKAFIWFKGYSGTGPRATTEFELQTTVSQRVQT